MSELKQAWEYCFIHSSATGRGDEEIGPCLTYEKSVAFGKGCFKQRELLVSTQPEATKPAQDLSAAIPEGWPTTAMINAGFAARLSGKIGSGFRAMLAAAPRKGGIELADCGTCGAQVAVAVDYIASPADALVAGDRVDARKAVFAAYSHCLANGDSMLPQEIADHLIAAIQAQKDGHD